MTTVHLVIDESGAKGYGENQEATPGEFGVMVGFLVPADRMSVYTAELTAVRAAFQPKGKVHITDSDTGSQDALRRDIFSFFIRNQVPWTYEAIYVQGFHQMSAITTDLIETARKGNTGEIRVSPRRERELLHSSLFQGVFSRGIEWSIAYAGPEVMLDVTSDHVDASVLARFKTAATDYLTVGQSHVTSVKGFNLKTRTLVAGSVVSKVVDDAGMLGDYSCVTFSVRTEDSPLTLAADVLANSLSHYLKLAVAHAAGRPLNAHEAITAHPLASLVYGVEAQSAPKSFSDSLFRHPAHGHPSDGAVKENEPVPPRSPADV